MKRMLDELRPLGLVGIGILPGPLRRPVGLKGRLVAPLDFRGRAIGEQQSRVARATLRALGARPIALAVQPSDTTGLSGFEIQLLSVAGRQLDVPGAHLSANVDLWPRPLVVFANARAYAGLSADERRILHRAAASVIPEMAAAQQGNDDELAGELCRRGRITFDSASASDIRALRAAVQPVYRELEGDPATRAALVAIAALKQQVAAPPASPAGCKRDVPRRTAARTLLDGTWRMDTPPGAAGSEELAENWGHWTFVFDHGRFAITQENRRACTWGYGTYSVAGDRTTWLFTDGGGQAPNGAQNKPGEKFSFRLSAYRDTLTLSAVKGAISPPNFDIKPWRRIGPPSREKLSRRCPPPREALAR